MPKVVKVVVKPLLNDKYEHLTIVDVNAPLVVDPRPVFSYITPKLCQLINNDVSYNEFMCCAGTVHNYSTKFGGNRKVYMLDGITYDVNFAFPIRR